MSKRGLEGKVIEAPKDGIWYPVQVVLQRAGKFTVRSEVGDAAEWDVDGPEIRERGSKIGDAAKGDTVLILTGVKGVEAEVISREGDNLKVRDGSGEENVFPLQSACLIGTAVAREDLLAMCAKRDVRAEDETDAGGEAAAGGGVDGKKPTLAKMESNVSGTDGSEIDAGEMKKSFFKMSNPASLEEIDMEQLVAAAPQPPPCAELVLGEIPVHVDGGGTCKGEKINGLLQCNPVTSRWSVLVDKSSISDVPVRYALGDFIKTFVQVKVAARSALIHTATGNLVIPEFEESSLQNKKWYQDCFAFDDRRSSKKEAKSSKKDRSVSKRKESDDIAERQPFNIPEWRFTPVVPDPRGVMLSPWDRAPQLRLADDNMSASGNKGYRIARATHGVSEGAWYCEATVREDFPQIGCSEKFLDIKGHVRLGWARSSAFIQAPVGYDRFGYAICSKTGHTVHARRPKEYAPPITAGDTIGFYIYLPPKDGSAWDPAVAAALALETSGGDPAAIAELEDEEKKQPKLKGTVQQPGGQSVDVGVVEAGPTFGSKNNKKRDQLEWKGTGTYYYLDEDKDKGSDVHEGSSMRFSVNGKDYGVAFSDVQAGHYYPGTSLYMGGHVTYNFGPDFKHPPPPGGYDGCGWNPISLLQPARKPPSSAPAAETVVEAAESSENQGDGGGGPSGGAAAAPKDGPGGGGDPMVVEDGGASADPVQASGAEPSAHKQES